MWYFFFTLLACYADDLIVDPRNLEWLREANSPVVRFVLHWCFLSMPAFSIQHIQKTDFVNICFMLCIFFLAVLCLYNGSVILNWIIILQVADITHSLQQPAGRKVFVFWLFSTVPIFISKLVIMIKFNNPRFMAK